MAIKIAEVEMEFVAYESMLMAQHWNVQSAIDYFQDVRV